MNSTATTPRAAFIRSVMLANEGVPVPDIIAKARDRAFSLRKAAAAEAAVLRAGERGGWCQQELAWAESRMNQLLLRASRCRAVAIYLSN